MKITPQDIIDKEFRVKFRGFDMAEVDAFLEEVAENFFKLTEEVTLLNEKIGTLTEQSGLGGGELVQGQFEMPAELVNFLEELKQDTGVINAELASLKQDRAVFSSLEKNLKEAIGALHSAVSLEADRDRPELPPDFTGALDDFAKVSESLRAELQGLKEERQAFDSLKKEVSRTLDQIRAAGSSPAGQAGAESGELEKTLAELRQGNNGLEAKLSAIEQEVASIQKVHAGIKNDLQGLFKSNFDDLVAKLLQAEPAGGTAAAKPSVAAPKEKAEPLKAATIIEEEPEDTRVQEEEEEEAFEEDLEFLSEDDILDVDRLRNVFQSVLDDAISDGHESREGADETSADLLFLDDSFIELEPEPAVTFTFEEKVDDRKPKKGKHN